MGKIIVRTASGLRIVCSFKLPTTSKEVDTLAGYTKNREQNYEIKYMRKVLRQVDDRIQVPESVSGDSLRHLLDNVEAPVIRETTSRRPRWLSLQSGIAYAAAFTLIVALFYSTKLYRPDMISEKMSITASDAAASDDIILAHTPDGEAIDTNAPRIAAQAPAAMNNETSDELVPDSEAIPIADESAETASDNRPNSLGIGGGGKANLLLEKDEYAFYWRENDLNDPDRTSPISFEIVDTVTQEIVTHTDVPLAHVAQGFELNDNLVFIGTGFTGEAEICSYDVSVPGEPFVQSVFAQDGELVDAKTYNDIVRVVSVSERLGSDVESELLPNCISSETCVITAFDPKTQTVATKHFTGANGTVLLNDSGAYISYTGQDDEGENKEYTAQILFDGMDITLGTVE